MRRGEILGLRWGHIDLERRIAHLPLTKNGECRDVPLSSRAVGPLNGLMQQPDRDAERVSPVSGNAVYDLCDRIPRAFPPLPSAPIRISRRRQRRAVPDQPAICLSW